LMGCAGNSDHPREFPEVCRQLFTFCPAVLYQFFCCPHREERAAKHVHIHIPLSGFPLT
jgi:hypothetical protein